MMTQALCISHWTIDADGNNTPGLFADHPMPMLCKWEDVTGTPAVPPAPNLVAVQFSTFPQADPATVAAWLAAVEADANYLVVWSDTDA
jgi:hypothetical protein